MSTKYYVGDQAPSPLILHVKRSDGSIIDLTPYTTVVVEGDDLPPGDTTVLDAEAGIVQRTFDEGFTSAGMLFLRVRLESGGFVDYTDPAELPVLDPRPNVTLMVTTGQVEAYTGVAVSENDVAQAQSLVGLVTGRNLGDASWLSSIAAQDLFWLQQAVAWQAAEHPEGDGLSVALPYVPGASSITNGDVSISYRDDAGDELATLAANARLAIRRLSWMRSVRSVSATPFLSDRGAQPSSWVPVSRGL